MQQLGGADAVENVDAEARLPALPTNSGSASPAEVQIRNRVPPRSLFSVSSFSIAENNVGTPKKMLGLYLFISANIVAGVGRSELSTVVAPTDIGKVSALPRP